MVQVWEDTYIKDNPSRISISMVICGLFCIVGNERMICLDDIVNSGYHIIIGLLFLCLPFLPARTSLALLAFGGIGLSLVKYIISQLVHYNLPSQGRWASIGQGDVALVTGGSRGLGLEMVKNLQLKNCGKIIILDIISPPPMEESKEESRITFIPCNIGDELAIKSTLAKIVKDLQSEDKHVSICINNAGIDHRSSVLDITDAEIHNIFLVNTMAQIWTLRTIINNHRKVVSSDDKKLFVVSVASILGVLAPRNLSIYLATKAAIIQIHEGLTQELKDCSQTIRLLLVTPGQLDTNMFNDVENSNNFLAPVVGHVALAHEIVRRIDIGHAGVLATPLYANFLPMVKCLPIYFQDICRWFSGMDDKIVPKLSRRN